MKKLINLIIIYIVITNALNAQTNYFSYQNGNWDSPLTWTTDPSGFILTGSSVPNAGDNVTILNGRTITINTSISPNLLTIQSGAILDFGSTTGHNINILNGTGKMRIATSGFPTVATNNFVTDAGGTIELYNYSGNIPNYSDFNHVEINSTDGNNHTITLNRNITIAGNLTISATGSGTANFKIGNDATPYTITVKGNISVGSNCNFSITSGNNVLHTLNLYGNLTNNGTFSLSNNSTPFLSTYTNGAAELNILGSKNSLLTINSNTKFYNFILNKGNDQTFVTKVLGTNLSEPFQGSKNNNTITLENGTLQIGTNIKVSQLSNNTDYTISSGVNDRSGLWIDGGDVSFTGNNLTVYGTINVSAGKFTATIGLGTLIIYNSGTAIFDGGISEINQLRAATDGVLFPNLIHSGGTLNINGLASSNYYSFDWNIQDASIEFSGSTSLLRVYPTRGGTAVNGAIRIASAKGNYTITGGTINAYSQSAHCNINTTCPFWNLNTLSSGLYQVQIISNPLIVYNNLSISDGTLNANNQDITIGKNFTISAAKTYIPGTNRTIFNGSGLQYFVVNGIISGNLSKLIINKSVGTLLQSGTNNITINDSLQIFQGTYDDGGKIIDVKGNIYNNGNHIGIGRIRLSGSSLQTIDCGFSGTSSFGNIELANTIAAGNHALQLLTDINVAKFIFNGSLTPDRGLVYLDIYQLYITENDGLKGSAYGPNKMFKTAGTIGCGSLKRYIELSGDYGSTVALDTFPIGTTSHYCPFILFVAGTAGNTEGTLNVIPVYDYHPTLGTDGVRYWWRTKVNGFNQLASITSIKYRFIKDAAIPDKGPKTIYITPSGDWDKDFGGDVSGDIFSFPANINDPGRGFLATDFSSGNPGSSNKLTTYYTIASGRWTDNIWSTTGHTGSASGTYPQNSTDIAQIGGVIGSRNDTVYMNLASKTIGAVTIQGSYTTDGKIPTLNMNTVTTVTLNIVQGDGKFKINTNTLPPNTSFRDFCNSEYAIFEYGGNGYILPVEITTYPNLNIYPSSSGSLTMPDRNILVRKNFRINNPLTTATKVNLNSTTSKILTILGDIEFDNQAKMVFQASGASQILNIFGDINFESNESNDANSIEVADAVSSIEHKINMYGNQIKMGASNMTLFRASNKARVNFYFLGNNNQTITQGTASNAFNYLIINKETINNTVTISNNFTLPIYTPEINKPIQLIGGTLYLNNPSLDIFLTNEAPEFTIPENSALIVNQGKVKAKGANNGIYLDGLLQIQNTGYADFDDETNPVYIEYSNSGNAQLFISGGTLDVGSQIRMKEYTSAGSLKFNQSGGTINIRGIEPTPASKRAKFEVAQNSQSYCHFSGGSINIINAGTASVGDIYIHPIDNSATGGIITLGSLETTSSNEFVIDVSIPFYNLNIGNASTSITASLQNQGIIIKNNLNILSNSIFKANGLNIKIGGNLANGNNDINTGISTGGFQAGNHNQTVIFNGASNQLLSGTGNNTANFANIKIDKNNTLTISNITVEINDTLYIKSGTISDDNNWINCYGHIENYGIHTSPTGSVKGIKLNGSSQQNIKGLNGQFGNITLNNAQNILVFSDQRINGMLDFVQGKLDIGSYQLTMGPNSYIQNSTTDKYVNTFGSSDDRGIKRIITPSIPVNFIFPIGCAGKYTPVTINSGTSNIAGTEPYFQVAPVNLKHHTLISEPPHALDFFWKVSVGGGFATTSLSHSYQYSESDIYSGDLENTYIAAHLPFGALEWIKEGTVNYTTPTGGGTITFDNFTNITGDYTAGQTEMFGEIMVYYTRSDGSWTDIGFSTTPWITSNNTPASTVPTGAILYIRDSIYVNNTDNFRNAYRLILEPEGVLDLKQSIGNNFLYVEGSGKIKIEGSGAGSFVFPGGNYDAFVSPNRGTIEYYGAGTTFNRWLYNNVTFTGTSFIDIPDVDLVCNGNVTINQGQLRNLNSKNISLKGNWINKVIDGFIENSGKVTFNGTSSQTIQAVAGYKETFFDLEVNNSTEVRLLSNVDVTNSLNLVKGYITTKSDSLLTITNSSPTCLSRHEANNPYINGPLRKLISNSSNFDFPVGKSSRYGNIYLLVTSTSGDQYWTAEYFNNKHTNTTSITSPIKFVSQNEYWSVSGPSINAIGKFKLRWDELSGVPATLTERINYLRIAQYIFDSWQNVGTTRSYSGNASYGTIAFDNDTTLTNKRYFTLAVNSIQNFEWTGATNRLWSVASNWNPQVVPYSGAEITIPDVINDPIADINVSCGSIFLASGATLSINPKKSITLSGDLTLNGTLNLLSDATGTGMIIDNETITGTGAINSDLYLTASEYHMIAAPISNADTTTFTLTGWNAINPNFYIFNETAQTTDWLKNWEKNPSRYLSVARGYSFYPGETKNYTMWSNDVTKINTGNIYVTITHTAHPIQTTNKADGWNLIGNPYPSGLDAYSFINQNVSEGNILGTLYFWDDDHSNGTTYTSADYAAFNLSGYVGGGSGKIPNGIISIGQGFFVKSAKAEGEDSYISFSNLMRRADESIFFKNYNLIQADEMNIQRIKISITDQDNQFNEILLAFHEKATENFDILYDGQKLFGNSKLGFYSLLQNEPFAIQSFPLIQYEYELDKSIPLGVNSSKTGNVRFNLSSIENIHNNLYIYLEDNKYNKLIDLKKNNSYFTEITIGKNIGRFFLRLTYNELTPIDNPMDNKIQIWSYEKDIYIRYNSVDPASGTVKIYNLYGQLVENYSIQNQNQIKLPLNKVTGIYIVQSILNGQTESKKVFIK